MENPRCSGTIMKLVTHNKPVFPFISSFTCLLLIPAILLK